ncbi:MAG: hypothetical protein RL026_1198 [Pseudomonadota bacterium]
MLDLGSPRCGSVAAAARRAFGDEPSSLELYHCGEQPVLSPGWADHGSSTRVYDDLLRGRQLADLERLADRLRSSGQPVSVTTEPGTASDDTIRAHWEATAPDLIVKEGGDPVAPRPGWLQRTDDLLLRHCACPFLLVGAASMGKFT